MINNTLPEPEREFEIRDNKEYEIEIRVDSAMNGQQANDQMPSLYYFVLWKDTPEEKSTWKLSLAVIYLGKLISMFYKDHPENSTATSPPLDSAPPMAGSTVSTNNNQNISVAAQAKEVIKGEQTNRKCFS